MPISRLSPISLACTARTPAGEDRAGRWPWRDQFRQRWMSAPIALPTSSSATAFRRARTSAFSARTRRCTFELLFGINKAGSTMSPMNWRLAAPELAAVIADAEAPLMFVDRDLTPLIRSRAGDQPAGRSRSSSLDPLAERQRAALMQALAGALGRRSARMPLDAGAGGAADLHLGHHRQAEGRGADPSRLPLHAALRTSGAGAAVAG